MEYTEIKGKYLSLLADSISEYVLAKKAYFFAAPSPITVDLHLYMPPIKDPVIKELYSTMARLKNRVEKLENKQKEHTKKALQAIESQKITPVRIACLKEKTRYFMEVEFYTDKFNESLSKSDLFYEKISERFGELLFDIHGPSLFYDLQLVIFETGPKTIFKLCVIPPQIEQ